MPLSSPSPVAHSAEPLVTVVTATKNRRALVSETIDSVVAQTFQAWEHIIVDDGSDDGTCEEVRRRAAVDWRIRYIRRTGSKSGANVCRNLGIRESRADLVVFLDSDDLLVTECLGRRVEIMRRNPDLDFAVFPASVFVDTVNDLGRLFDSQIPGDDLLRFLSLDCPWEISGPIWRRDFLQRIGLFDDTLLSMQDVEMHVRAIAARGRYLFFGPVDHHIRWQNDHSKTSVRHFADPAYIQVVQQVRDKLFGTVISSDLLTWSRHRALAGLCFGAAESLVALGDLVRGLETWNRGCRNQQTPRGIQLAGCVMLCAARVSRGDGSILARLVHKWKGWVRFRQEPALLHRATTGRPSRVE
jgi:glycosyltransferase involved in cell wall biosynthesis